MTAGEEKVRMTVAYSLAYLGAAMAIYLWFVDLVSMQRSFGAVLAAELLVFAMLIYVYMKPGLRRDSTFWILLGCAFLAALLIIAL